MRTHKVTGRLHATLLTNENRPSLTIPL